MNIILGVLIATLAVAVMFIGFMPEEWVRWIVLWACIFVVFAVIYGVILLMGVSLV